MTWVCAALLAGMAAAVAPHVLSRPARRAADPIHMEPPVGMPGGPPTTVEGLRDRIGVMERRLQAQPDDIGAAVLLADALLRQARATNDGRPANRAGQILSAVLKKVPGQYDALRMLGAIYLSQHRFREGLDVARRARDFRPNDAWNYGVIGDALIELGEYGQAFQAFQTMMTMRPNAAAYARAAYSRELQGDLNGAVEAMRMAGVATTGQDPEAKAWYLGQVAELHLRMGRLDEASREFQHASFVFPNYPHAIVGQGKVLVARGDPERALEIYLQQLKRTPTVDLAARIGDLYAERKDRLEAERYYQLAEDLAGPGLAQTEATLAMFLAEHDRKLPEAVKIAEMVAGARQDIFTEDALAWAYFKVGRIDEALAASNRALRTGSRDERIMAHAARIRAASLARGPG